MSDPIIRCKLKAVPATNLKGFYAEVYLEGSKVEPFHDYSDVICESVDAAFSLATKRLRAIWPDAEIESCFP